MTTCPHYPGPPGPETMAQCYKKLLQFCHQGKWLILTEYCLNYHLETTVFVARLRLSRKRLLIRHNEDRSRSSSGVTGYRKIERKKEINEIFITPQFSGAACVGPLRWSPVPGQRAASDGEPERLAGHPPQPQGQEREMASRIRFPRRHDLLHTLLAWSVIIASW